MKYNVPNIDEVILAIAKHWATYSGDKTSIPLYDNEENYICGIDISHVDIKGEDSGRKNG